MEVNDFNMWLIDVTFYLHRVKKLIFDVLIKKMQNANIIGPAVKGLICRKALPSRHQTLTQCWVKLGHRLRRWPNINPTLSQCFVSVGYYMPAHYKS